MGINLLLVIYYELKSEQFWSAFQCRVHLLYSFLCLIHPVFQVVSLIFTLVRLLSAKPWLSDSSWHVSFLPGLSLKELLYETMLLYFPQVFNLNFHKKPYELYINIDFYYNCNITMHILFHIVSHQISDDPVLSLPCLQISIASHLCSHSTHQFHHQLINQPHSMFQINLLVTAVLHSMTNKHLPLHVVSLMLFDLLN